MKTGESPMRGGSGPDHPLPPILDGLAGEVWHQSAAGLCLIDEGGEVLCANLAFAHALGYEADEMVGMAISRLHPPDVMVAMKALHRSLVEDAPATVWAGREMRFQHRRGRPITGYARNARFTDAEGEVYRLITMVNLSDIVRADYRLEQMQRAENFSALASAVSNDLNNLLSIILGYTALLQDGQADARRLRVVSEGVEGAVHRASTLVRQTLYLARRPDASLRPIGLNGFVEQRVEAARAVIGERAFELELSTNSKLAHVPVDQGQLGDALDEALQRVHAVDPEGLRPLRVRTLFQSGEEVRHRFVNATDSEYALVEISHAGRPRSASRSPFSAIDLSEATSGTDLGITMIERIVESHRGYLAYQTFSGGGVSFTLCLPLAAMAAESPRSAPATEKPVAEPTKARGRRILVIDDESGLLETIVETLIREGYDAIGVTDGPSALKVFREHAGNFDLVICDLVLPKMNGWEVFTGIRDIRPDAPVVIMSGHLEPKLKDAVQRSGALGFLQKPFSMGAFLRFVQKLVPSSDGDTP